MSQDHSIKALATEIHEAVEQIESCHFECEAGPLENNVGYITLKKIAIDLEKTMRDVR